MLLTTSQCGAMSRFLLSKSKAWFLRDLYTAKALGFYGCHLGHVEKLHTVLKYRTTGSDLTPNDKYRQLVLDNESNSCCVCSLEKR